MYNSALPLCPTPSWIHTFYSTVFSQNARVVVGSTEWGMSTRTVSCCNEPDILACWNNTIACSSGNDIIFIDALTGSQKATCSGNTGGIQSLAFSSDGILLVSGSFDKTVKLCDVQTGGVAKTLYGHTDRVTSVSISADDAMIASGSDDKTIRLWNVETGSCLVAVKHVDPVWTVTFSPTDSKLLLSSTWNTVQQWSIDGHQIGSPIPGCQIAFSPDGTQFFSWEKKTVTIRNTNSRMVMAEFDLDYAQCYCFSPDGRFIAAAAAADGHTLYLWDITNPDPCLIQTLTGHTGSICSLVFSSSLTLVSASQDGSIKFWQIGGSSADPVTPNTGSTPLTPAPIKVVSLQAKDGLAFSLDSEGVVKTWDILAGWCKETCTTPAKDAEYGDMQLIGDRLIIVWSKYQEKVNHVWDAGEGRLQTIDAPGYYRGLRITGDGSRVIQLTNEYIQAWSIWTGESTGMQLERHSYYTLAPLRMDGSKILAKSSPSDTVWDFGAPGSTPIQFSATSSDRPHLNFIDYLDTIEDSVTRREVFQLHGRYAKPSVTQWDGQYLIAGYKSGKVLILDFSPVLA